MNKTNPNQGYSYLMMLGHTCNDISQGALPALLPFLVLLKDIDYASAAALIFATSFFSSLLQPFLGMLTDKKSMPWLMGLGMFISGLGIAMVGYLPSYHLIFASVLFAGFGTAMFHPEAARMANFVAGETKGKGMSLFTAGGNLGFIIGPILVAFAVGKWGLKGTGVLIIPVLIVGSIFLLNQKNFSKFSGILSKEDTNKKLIKSQENDWKSFIKLCFPLFTRSIVNTGLQVCIPLYWVGVLLQTEQKASLMVTIMGIAATIATLISGRMADRFGFKKIITTAFMVMPPLFLAFLMTNNLVFATVLVILLSAAANFAYSPLVALGQHYLPVSLGLASGVTLGVSVSVGGIFSPILGKIGDSFGLPSAIFTVGIVSVLGLAGSMLLKEYRRGQE